MKKSAILVLVLSLVSVIFNSYAQKETKHKISSSFGKKIVQADDGCQMPKIIEEIVTKRQDDTIYCLATEKKFGWQTPVGIITKEEAYKRAFCVRLSNKNNAGNFCSLELLGKGLTPIAGGLSMTISKFLPDSIVKASDYLQSCSNAHRLIEIPDYSGKHIIQERIYDVSNNLLGYILYNYNDNYSKIKDSYFGPNGLPVKIDESETSPYGVQLNSIYDKNGNDSILFLTTGNSVVPNKDDAYYWQCVHTYDEKGKAINIIRSLDINYLPMIDKYGNCGMYNILDRFNNDSISTFIDKNDNPITLPEASYDKNFINVSSVRFTNDYNLFKIKSFEYFNIDGNQCENILGTHKVVVEYDSLGNEILRQGFDLNNNLSPIDDSGVSKYSLVWDTIGNIIEYHQFDLNNKPVSKNGNNSSYYNRYDPDTKKLISQIGYIYNDSIEQEEIIYSFKYSPRVDSLLYYDKTSKVVNYDSLGRVTCIRFFDKFGMPDENTYCAVDSTEYIFNDAINKTINREFRANGLLQSEIITDSILYTKTFYLYNENGYKTDSYQQRYDIDWSLIGQTDCSEFGMPARAGGNAGVIYLYADVNRTFDGAFKSFEILDEFNEPDYLVNLYGSGEIYSSFGKNESRYQARILRDEFGNEISENDYKNLQNKLPKVMSIEVVDSLAYDLGFRDNDVILVYGDFSSNLEDIPTFYDFRRDWVLASILEADKISRMVVFRIEDAKNNIYGLVELKNLKGTLSQLGINAHIRYLTQRQKERIVSSIIDNKNSLTPILIDTDFKNTRISEGDNYILLAYTDMIRTVRDKPYAKQVTDPAVLLGACIKDRDLYWTMDSGEETDTFVSMLNSRNFNESRSPGMNMYFTTDLIQVKPLYLQDQGVYINWFDTKVSDDVYNTLLKLNKLSLEKIDSIKSKSPSFRSKDLIASWQTTQINSDTDYRQVTGNLNLKKNGKCEGKLYSYGKISFNEGDAIYQIEKDYLGVWQLADSLIRVDPYLEDNIKLTCVDLLGADEELKNRAIAYMNSICETNKEDLLNKMTYLGIPCSDDLFIHSMNKDSLYIDNGSEWPIVFSKATRTNKSSNIKKMKSRTNLQSKDKNKIQKNPLLIGNWEAGFPDVPGSLVTLFLNDDKSMSLTIHATIEQKLSETSVMSAVLSIKLGGEWDSFDNIIKFSNDLSLMVIDIDIDISGVSNDEAELIKPLLLKELNSQKEELAMSILKNNPFDGEMSVSEITYASFIMNGNKWIRKKD